MGIKRTSSARLNVNKQLEIALITSERMDKVTILIFLIALSFELYGFPMPTNRNFEESGYFEGDMKLDAGRSRVSMMKMGLTNERFRWPRSINGTVIVHYTIRNGSPYSKEKFKVKV